MSKKVAFYSCDICKNMVGLIKDGGGELVCCGKPMELLKTNTTDGAKEKHVPVVTRDNGKLIVKVGSALHPMLQEHFIEWIAVVSESSTTRISLAPGMNPEAAFTDPGECDVYAYCNLHGLWKA